MKELVWKTEKRKVKDLVPYDLNARKISKTKLEQLKKSYVLFTPQKA